MQTIHKQSFDLDDAVVLEVPKSSVILSVQSQHGRPTIWYKCDTEEKETKNIIIQVRGTGHDCSSVDWGSYIDTVQFGSLVFHFFTTHPKVR